MLTTLLRPASGNLSLDAAVTEGYFTFAYFLNSSAILASVESPG